MTERTILPLEWDVDAVQDFYIERGLDFEKFGPHAYSRRGTLSEKSETGDTFYNAYAQFLARRAQK